jgi:hypothetical protein
MIEPNKPAENDISQTLNELMGEVFRLRKELAAAKKAAAGKRKAGSVQEKIILNPKTAKTGLIYSEILGPAVSKRKRGSRAY